MFYINLQASVKQDGSLELNAEEFGRGSISAAGKRGGGQDQHLYHRRPELWPWIWERPAARSRETIGLDPGGAQHSAG